GDCCIWAAVKLNDIMLIECMPKMPSAITPATRTARKNDQVLLVLNQRVNIAAIHITRTDRSIKPKSISYLFSTKLAVSTIKWINQINRPNSMAVSIKLKVLKFGCEATEAIFLIRAMREQATNAERTETDPMTRPISC